LVLQEEDTRGTDVDYLENLIPIENAKSSARNLVLRVLREHKVANQEVMYLGLVHAGAQRLKACCIPFMCQLQIFHDLDAEVSGKLSSLKQLCSAAFRVIKVKRLAS
jgi:hypothetical protein